MDTQRRRTGTDVRFAAATAAAMLALGLLPGPVGAAWAGTCRQLVLPFEDGTTARAQLKFK